MKFPVSREILLLSLAFLFSFAGFNGVQLYITTFFAHIGLPQVGFQSLIPLIPTNEGRVKKARRRVASCPLLFSKKYKYCISV